MREGLELANTMFESVGKILGAGFNDVSSSDFAASPQSISRLTTPYLTIDRAAVAANIATLQSWCEGRGYLVAPHGKTTMSPQLWQRQLDAGAWGITVATTAQLHIAAHFGVRRVMFANPIASRAAAARIRALVAANPDLTVLSWVDSEDAVDALDDGGGPPLGVLLDVGRAGGRTGVRDLDEGRAIVQRIRRARGVKLAGTATYEGAIGGSPSRADTVSFVQHVLGVHRELVAPHLGEEGVFSIGGSYRLGEVATGLSDVSASDGRVIIRSGVSIVHDDGHYDEEQQTALPGTPRFGAALRLVTTVVSVHAEVVLIDAGRRDTGSDLGMPVALELWRNGEVISRTGTPVPLMKLNDQHGHVPDDAFPVRPRVGDQMVIGISHPCTTFDKWREIVEIDGPVSPDSVAVGAVRTYF